MKKERKSIVELWRFICAIIIMLFHSYLFLGEKHPFLDGWLFVEFFMILTGFFTFEHFYSVQNNSLEDISKVSIIYSVRKYFSFIPYVIINLFGIAIYDIFINGHKCIDVCGLFITESTLITTDGGSTIGSLWYLSMLLMVFPIFCCFCQVRAKHFIYIMSMLYIFWFWKKFDLTLFFNGYPEGIYRMLNGLLTGILAFYVVNIISDIDFSKIVKIFLTIIEEGALLYAVFATFDRTNEGDSVLLIVICIFVGITLMLSNKTYSSMINNKLFGFLGKISLVIYIVHTPVALLMDELSIKNVKIYIIASLIISILLFYIVESLRKKVNFNLDKLKL